MRVYVVTADLEEKDGGRTVIGVYQNEQDAKFEIGVTCEFYRLSIYDTELLEFDI